MSTNGFGIRKNLKVFSVLLVFGPNDSLQG